MTQNSKDQDWLAIAEQASKEMNGDKLMILVAQLCSALDERGKPPVLGTQFCAESNSRNVPM